MHINPFDREQITDLIRARLYPEEATEPDTRTAERTLAELRTTLAAWERSYDERAAQLTREGRPEGAYISQTRAGVVREVFAIIGRDYPEA